uniref:Putative tripeptidyl-peptidase 2 n=1 Tax=Lutzomyia longipalpis TaxID=7200 RepID=A0A7G3B1B0_LUTLO
MNGTSMAAPHVAGSVALLISGLKKRKIPYSPYSIKRALTNTATQLKTVDPFAQGSGLLNVERAFDHLVDNAKEPEVSVRFGISVSNGGAKGIHIRHGVLTKPEEFSVNVEPVFFNEKDTPPKEKINFNIRLILTPSNEWVQCGKFLDLCYSARSFFVRIDPTGLQPGVHQSSIRAYDTKNVDKGPVFEVPITVVQPNVVGAEQLFVHRIQQQVYLPNTIVRQFLNVPRYATWAVLKLRADDANGGKFLVHTMQVLPSKYCKALETHKIVAVSNECDTLVPFKCEGDNILEVCIAKYWSNLGQTSIMASVEFHGVFSPNGSNGIHRIDMRALRTEEVLPSITLKNAVVVLRPTESSITPLTNRDVLPPSRQIYQNVLTYSLNLAKHQEFSLHAPLFSSVLYESEFESQFWMIFDKNCMMVGCGDAYSHGNFIKLEKGEYTIRLQVPPKEKINFNIRLILTPSNEWVQCGKFLDLCYSARSFFVRIDPTGLQPGVHQSSIRAYDTKNVDKGPVFEVPITVVQPNVVGAEQLFVHRIQQQVYLPNTIVRQFLNVPRYATWAVLKLRADDANGGKFLVHTMQVLPSKYCKALETHKIVAVSNECDTLVPFKCEGDNILEVCIAKYWSNLGQTSIMASVEFHGVFSPNGSNGIHRIDMRALRTEEVLPSISLKNAVVVLRPTESLNLAKHQEFSLHAPLFSSVLYESEFESQFWMIFDKNCMMVGCGDAYSHGNFIKLEKGEYTIRLQIRHEKKELLEKVSETTMIATFKLQSPIYLDIYKSFSAAMTGGKKIAAFQLSNKSPKPIYVTPLTNEKVTKAGLPSQCSWLDGTVVFAKDEHGRKVDTVVFQYILIEGQPLKKANGMVKENKGKLEEYKEGLRDYQNGMIPKLDLADAEEIYQELIVSNPKYLAAHVALIQNLETGEPKAQMPHGYMGALEKIEDKKPLETTLNRIIDLADLVIRETDVDALLSYYGMKTDTRADAAKIKASMDKQKGTLLEAYTKKIIAMGKLHLLTITGVDLDEVLNEADEVFTGIAKFGDVNDSKYLPVGIWHAFLHKHFGRMSKYLHKLYEEKQQREILEEQRRVFRELKWGHVEKVMDRIIVNANPQTYRLF